MTWRSKVALPASWDGPVDVMGRVGREALENHIFLRNFCMISNQYGFSDTFFQMVGDTQRLYLQLYKSMIFAVVRVVGCESSLALPSVQALS